MNDTPQDGSQAPDAFVLEYEVSPQLLRAVLQAGPLQTQSFWTKPAALYSRRTKVLGAVGVLMLCPPLGWALATWGIPIAVFLVVLGIALGSLVMMLLWQRIIATSLKAFVEEDAKLATARGKTRVMISPKGCVFENGIGAARLDWAGVTTVQPLPGATLLRSGAIAHPLPHSALPEGLPPEVFEAQIKSWRAAA